MKRLLGLLGWLGVALVVAAVVLRFSKPELQQLVAGPGAGGPGRDRALQRSASGATSRGRSSGRNVKYGSIAASQRACWCWPSSSAINWIASRENKRWDLTAGGQFSLSDQTKKILAELKQPARRSRPSTSRPCRATMPRPADGVHLPVEAGLGRLHRRGPQPDRGAERRHHRPCRRSSSSTTGRTERATLGRRAERDQRAEEGHRGQGEEDLLRAGPRRARHPRRPTRPATAAWRTR